MYMNGGATFPHRSTLCETTSVTTSVTTQVDVMRNRLFYCRAVDDAASGDEITTMIKACNEQLKARPDSSWPARLSTALVKARTVGCFLGLDDYAWLDGLESSC